MEKQIFLPVDVKKEMITTFKTTKETLWAALNHTSNSSFSRLLRAAAYERGGVLYLDQRRPPCPMRCETVFDTADRTMIQTFGPDVRLIGNLESGKVSLYVSGDLKATSENPSLLELAAIQTTAQDLANELLMAKEV